MSGIEILERRATRKIVKNMLEAGMPIDEIVRCTKIDREFVQAVANDDTPAKREAPPPEK